MAKIALSYFDLKWYLHRRENILRCRYCQQLRFEKMGEFLLKSHHSAKSLDPNPLCKWTFKEQKKYVAFLKHFNFFEAFIAFVLTHTLKISSLNNQQWKTGKKYRPENSIINGNLLCLINLWKTYQIVSVQKTFGPYYF